MNYLLTILTCVLLTVSAAFAQDDDSYKETLETMFKMSGSEEAYETALNSMFDMFKQQYTIEGEDIWSELEKEFKKASLQDLIDMLVPVYQKYLTEEDLAGIIAFYKTPVGAKYASQTPLILKESMQVGAQWGMKLGEDFSRRMEEKGY